MSDQALRVRREAGTIQPPSLARNLLVVAGLTLREAARRRILWVLVVLTVLSVGLTGFGVERLVSLARRDELPEVQIQIGVSQVLILTAFMFSFVLAMTAAFLAAPAIAGDLESGVALSMLARPLRRGELLLGKWIGLSVIVVGYAVASGLLEIGFVRFVTGYGPPDPLGAVVFLSAQSIVLLTLGLAISTRLASIAGGAISVVVFGLAWMAGVLGGVGALFGVGALVQIAELSRWILPTDGLWRGVVYSLEPPLVILLAGGRQGAALQANPFYASAPPPVAFLVWVVIWLALVLGAGIVSFRWRDL